MLALRFASTGSLDALAFDDIPAPVCGPDDVVVRVQFAGMNPSDMKNVLGRFSYTTLPRTPGRDFSGVVIEGPPDLLGVRVWGTGCGLGFSQDGSHAEKLLLPAAGVARIPSVLSSAQAAACGVPYTTAFDALERCGVSRDTKILVIGANGAVGRAAVDLALARGARVIAAVRRVEECERIQRETGVQTLLLGQPTELETQTKNYFPGGAEVVFDTTGFWLPASVSCLTSFGRIAVIAAPVDGHVQAPILALYRKGGSIVGINSLLYDTVECTRMLEKIGAAMARGELALPAMPVEVPFDDALDIYRQVHAGDSRKFVFRM